MLVNNCYNFLRAAIFGVNGLKVKNSSGTEYGINTTGSQYANLLFGAANWIQGQSATGIVLGTDDTPVTIDDYKIRGTVLTASTHKISATGTKTTTLEENAVKHKFVLTIVNSGSSDVTIKEVAYNQQYSSNVYIMLDRTVLDTPLTIPAGGVGQLTYTITVNLPVFPTE